MKPFRNNSSLMTFETAPATFAHSPLSMLMAQGQYDSKAVFNLRVRKIYCKAGHWVNSEASCKTNPVPNRHCRDRLRLSKVFAEMPDDCKRQPVQHALPTLSTRAIARPLLKQGVPSYTKISEPCKATEIKIKTNNHQKKKSHDNAKAVKQSIESSPIIMHMRLHIISTNTMTIMLTVAKLCMKSHHDLTT